MISWKAASTSSRLYTSIRHYVHCDDWENEAEPVSIEEEPTANMPAEAALAISKPPSNSMGQSSNND